MLVTGPAVRLGGAWGPWGGVCGEIVAGQEGIGLTGYPEGRVVGPPLLFGAAGKNLICSGVIWQTWSMAGARIWVMRSLCRNFCLPVSLEMRTSSTGHLAGGREAVSPSVCLWAGTNRMWPVGIWISVSMLGWLRIAAEAHGVSSYTRSTSTTKSGVVVSTEEASA